MSIRDDYARQRLAGARAWHVFPPSAGVVCAALLLAITLDPVTSVLGGLGLWFVMYIFRQAMPDIYDRNLWSGCSLVILPVGVWFIRWVLVIVAGGVALLRNAPLYSTVITVSVLLVFDVVIQRRGTTEDPFNKALEHYRKLEHTMGNSQRHRAELLEIIRLCQRSIQQLKGGGDAYVLLANAMAMAAIQARIDGRELAHEYLLSRASAVIYHWSLGGVWTRNERIGDHVLGMVANQLAEWKDLASTQVGPEMQVLHAKFYDEAVDPRTLPMIRHVLMG